MSRPGGIHVQNQGVRIWPPGNSIGQRLGGPRHLGHDLRGSETLGENRQSGGCRVTVKGGRQTCVWHLS